MSLTVRSMNEATLEPGPHSPGESPMRGGGPAPLGRARGEGQAVADMPASTLAFPANEAVRAEESSMSRAA